MATLTTEYQYLGRSSGMTAKSGYATYYLLLFGKSVPNKTTGIHKVYTKFYLASDKNSTFYWYSTEYNGKINNTQVFGSSTDKEPRDEWELSSFKAGDVTYTKATFIKEGSLEVDCTNGLSKDIPLSAYWKIVSDGGDTYVPASGTNRTVSVTATLPAIPRQATLVTASNINDEQNSTITYNNPAGSAVDKIEACIADSEGATIFVPYREVSKTSGSYTFNFTDAERNTLRQAATSNTLTIRYVLKTTIGGTAIAPFSYSNKTLTLINHTPTVSPTIVDTNATTIALTGDDTKLIRYHSNALATINAQARKYATITGQRITNGSTAVSGASTTFNAVSNSNFIFYAKDSRNNGVTKNVSLTTDSKWIEYIHLTCNAQPSNPTAEGNMTLNISGNYFNNSFGAVSNVLTLKYRMAAEGAAFGDWTTVTPTLSGNTYSTDIAITDLDYQTTYNFEVQAADKLETTPVKSFSVRTKTVFDWSDEDFQFNVPVNVDGSVSATGNISSSGNITVSGTINASGNITSNNTVKSNIVQASRMLSNEGRIASANLNHTYTEGYIGEKLNIASSAMTTGKPAGDGYIKTFFWDNSGAYDFQLFMHNNNPSLPPMQYRQRQASNWGAWYIVHPYKIGDVVITSTNVGATEMANRYGGTWELIDKEFTPYRSAKNEGYTVTSNASGPTCYFMRAGHSITFQIGFNTAVNVQDTTLHMGTFNINTVGVNGMYCDHSFMLFGDEAQSVAFSKLTYDGKINTYDQIPDSYIANPRWLEGTVTVTLYHGNMLDAACNKFYWKRTA